MSREHTQGAGTAPVPAALAENLFETAREALLLLDGAGRVCAVNPAFCRTFRMTPGEALGRLLPDLGGGQWASPRLRHLLEEGLPTDGVLEDFEVEHDFPNAGRLALLLNARRLASDKNSAALVLLAIEDVTAVKHAREESYRLRLELDARVQQAARLAAVVRFSDDAILAKTLDGIITDWNPTAERLFGYSAAEAVGRHISFLVPPDRQGELATVMTRLRAGEHIEPFETVRLHRDGRRIDVAVTVSPINEGGRVIGASAIQRDVTARKRAEEAVRRAEGLFRTLVEQALVGIYIIQDWRFRYVNPRLAAAFGYTQEEITGLPCWLDVVDPEDRPMVEAHVRQLLGGEVPVAHYALRGRRKDGSSILCEVRGARVEYEGQPAVIGTSLDVTERKRLEEQFQQAAKMEAVGRLAGGIAHDFNNLLTVINGYSELLNERLATDDARRELVLEIAGAGGRAAALTRQLLAFGRQAIVEPKVVDLRAILADTSKLLRRVIGEDIELVTVTDPELGFVRVDPGQMTQVLLNLVVNARDAMPLGGKLTVELRNVMLDPAYIRLHPGASAGPFVRLAVTDTGCGIPREALGRVWEPFFTTKGSGQGTGLGLAVVHGIVTQAGGRAEVYSEPTFGTTFKLYFPCVTEQPGGGAPPTEVTLPRGGEMILLAEDEDAVRHLAGVVLRTCGYTVVEAGDGEEALYQAEQLGERLELLVTDVVMPRLGGRELAERVRRLRPDVRVLYLSGYTDDAVVRHGILSHEVAFLQKPFVPAALARKVREVLDATPR